MTANADIVHGDGERRHLPECLRIEYIVSRHGYTLTAGSNGCICDRLRICERRVEETWSAIAGRDQYAEGYAAALNAARDAVAVVGVRKDTSYDMRVVALAAIDALREETK